MDDIDKKIIEILKTDANTPLSKVADIIGIPKPTVYLRFNKMKEEGIIRGFSLVLGRESSENLRAGIIKVKDYLLSDMGQRAVKNLGAQLSKRNEIIIAARISNNSIFVLWEGDFDARGYNEVVEFVELPAEVYKRALQ